MKKAIGGYFELELPEGDLSRVPSGTLVNSGRHALEYILRVLKDHIKTVYIPYYTCDVVLTPFRRTDVNYKFYHIDNSFEIAEKIDLGDGEYLLANNYFGIKDRYIGELSLKYGHQLIVDNAQAFYCNPTSGSNYIYSPRKYFGLPDGGIAVSVTQLHSPLPDGYSSQRCSHLLKRIDAGSQSGYADFRANSHQLEKEPLTAMSELTKRLLASVDLDRAKSRRRSNFKTLHEALGSSNRLILPDLSDFECPMVYPYLSENEDLRKTLIDNNIFVATYWPNIFEWCSPDTLEYYFAGHILPLPIDQRYGSDDMQRIINTINQL